MQSEINAAVLQVITTQLCWTLWGKKSSLMLFENTVTHTACKNREGCDLAAEELYCVQNTLVLPSDIGGDGSTNYYGNPYGNNGSFATYTIIHIPLYLRCCN